MTMKKVSEIATLDAPQWAAVEEVAASRGVAFSTFVAAVVSRALVPDASIFEGGDPREVTPTPESEPIYVRIRVSPEVQNALVDEAARLKLSKSMVIREIALAAAGAEQFGLVGRIQEITSGLRRLRKRRKAVQG